MVGWSNGVLEQGASAWRRRRLHSLQARPVEQRDGDGTAGEQRLADRISSALRRPARFSYLLYPPTSRARLATKTSTVGRRAARTPAAQLTPVAVTPRHLPPNQVDQRPALLLGKELRTCQPQARGIHLRRGRQAGRAGPQTGQTLVTSSLDNALYEGVPPVYRLLVELYA